MIPEASVQVVEGADGLIGKGALGEVRRGVYRDAVVALKQLHLLRTDAAATEEGMFALTKKERRDLQARGFPVTGF